mgnify:CR=1 FL=1
MPLPLLFKADGIHFQQTAVGNVADFHTDTCRTVFTHERRVHFVECGKIVHVGDKHRRLGDVGDGKAGGFEHGLLFANVWTACSFMPLPTTSPVTG